MYETSLKGFFVLERTEIRAYVTLALVVILFKAF